MKRSLSSRFLLCVVFTICVLIVAAIALSPSKGANPQASQDQSVTVPIVVNQTEALKVESLTSVDAPSDRGEKSYILTLKNVSSRKLVAWVVKRPYGGNVAAGAVISNGGWEPGESDRFSILDTSPNEPGPKQITIALAMFEDGSSEGDFSTHEFITNSRLASKLQTERINEILQVALLSRQNKRGRFLKTGKEWLQDLASEISQLSETPPPNQPLVVIGWSSPKDRSINLLKTLSDWEDARPTDSLKANQILRSQGSLFGASDVQDGVLKIIRHNENLLRKNSLKGGFNEK